MSFKQVAVLGSGQMGTGIALVMASHLERVILSDPNTKSLDRARSFCDSWVSKRVAKGFPESQKVLDKLSFVNSLPADIGGSDFIIEAVPEDLEIKNKLFQEVESIIGDSNAIIASNTSSISITKLASSLKNPERAIGMHFMNPVPQMKGVEVIRGLLTTDETLSATLSLVNLIQKEAFVCSHDRPGFIANRILMPYINEAIFCLQEGLASKEDIDSGMKLSTNVPMGPLVLADFIGLDTCLAIMNTLYVEFQDSKYRPAHLLKNYVDAGYLGRKTQKGFYTYNPK